MQCICRRPGSRPPAAWPRVLAVALALAGPAGAAGAAPACYTVDATRSQVEFRIHLFGFLSPGGRFDRVTGGVAFDPQHWDTLSVSIRIAVDSLESRPGFWHDELLGPRFFDRARFPDIAFDGQRAQQNGPDAGLAYGALTLRGITRPVTLVARLVTAGGMLDIDAETSVRRSDFGLGGVLPLASDAVSIALHLHATPGNCDGQAPASPSPSAAG
jgi:polyisoprenoid-binding protein YceI